MFTDIDEESALAESANSRGDGDSDSHVLLTVRRSNCIASKVGVMEQPLSPLSYLFDLINYASLILLNKLSILFHPIIVWPCGQYYKVQEWAHV